MKIIRKKEDILKKSHYFRQKGQRIGFVATMGALHLGHAALVSRAKASCDKVVVSLFLNPLQFNNSADLASYPQKEREDVSLLESWGTDIAFIPSEAEIYPSRPKIGFSLGKIGSVMEGRYRLGHLEGVAMVLCKLFHMVVPHAAFFGEKDWQQCLLARQLAKDLDFDLSIIFVETVRTAEGLALSSRNRALSVEGKKKALLLHKCLAETAKALSLAQAAKKEGLKEVWKGQQEAVRRLLESQAVRLEYFEAVESFSLSSLAAFLGRKSFLETKKSLSLCLAAYVEGVRLIDHLRVAFAGDSAIK